LISASPPGSSPAFEATPFLKWAGGKRRLVATLLRYMPRAWGAYHEPCLGGGALFFAIRGRFAGKAYLSDVNTDLICAYQAVRDKPHRLLEALEALPVCEERYVKLASMDPDHMDPLARGARTIYLNRCGFNGLWRVNLSGRFNVPWGKYRAPLAPVPALVEQAHRALQGAVVKVQDVALSLEKAQAGDLVYLDPPYHQTFAGYAAGGFGERDQQRLAQAARAAADRGVLVMASNSATPLIRQLYAGWRQVRVKAPRSISCKGSTRTQEAPELHLLSWR
jgi:DNA adenine methylase